MENMPLHQYRSEKCGGEWQEGKIKEEVVRKNEKYDRTFLITLHGLAVHQ